MTRAVEATRYRAACRLCADPACSCWGVDNGNGLVRSMRLSVRVQADRHSVLLMCVPESQKSMQACSVSPPPPGALGADSLGLAVEVVADEPGVSKEEVEPDVVFTPDEPPLDSMIWAGGGDRGATAGVSGTGAAMAEGGSEVVGIDVLGMAVVAAAAAPGAC